MTVIIVVINEYIDAYNEVLHKRMMYIIAKTIMASSSRTYPVKNLVQASYILRQL